MRISFSFTVSVVRRFRTSCSKYKIYRCDICIRIYFAVITFRYGDPRKLYFDIARILSSINRIPSRRIVFGLELNKTYPRERDPFDTEERKETTIIIIPFAINFVASFSVEFIREEDIFFNSEAASLAPLFSP